LGPRWDAPSKADDASIDQWNAFVAALEIHDEGHVDIYRGALRDIAESLSRIRADTEAALREKSERMFKDMMSRAEKRQQGHDRRSRRDPSEKIEKK
jgi:predicted secreted Zn-dependent protease